MFKLLNHHTVLADGTVFRALRVVPESVLCTGHGRIVLHNWRGLLKIRLTYAREQLDLATTYVVAHNSYRGYYHWLLESLPRLLEAREKLSAFTLLLPETYTEDFYGDTLRMLGVEQIARLRPGTYYHVPHLALPYLAEPMGSYSAPTLHRLRDTLLQALCPVAEQDPGTKLYVSRRKATRRRVINEAEVEQLLTAHGFQCVCFEDYTFAEQLALCAGARAMISLHGAGLSNMLFLARQALVVEFRKFDGGANYFFEQLARTLAHDYQLLYCQTKNENDSVQDADVLVDLAALTALLPA